MEELTQLLDSNKIEQIKSETMALFPSQERDVQVMHHKVIGDKYKIIDSIGKGGMGSVFLCENLFLKNNWAVKKVEIHKENFDDGEIEALKKLHHENIPQIVDYYIMDNCLYIVQSYIRGYSMPEYVNGYSLSEDLIKKWMIQLGSVIDYLHSIKPSPILHLDIKPGNIIVTPNENIVLVDFGSSIINRKHWNNSKTYSMTYSAPEQILGKPVGSFSDVFSYGKVFDKLLDTAITEGCISQNFYRKYKDIIKTALPLNPELREKNIKKVLNKIKEL